jgi:hypothetical protein
MELLGAGSLRHETLFTSSTKRLSYALSFGFPSNNGIVLTVASIVSNFVWSLFTWKFVHYKYWGATQADVVGVFELEFNVFQHT